MKSLPRMHIFLAFLLCLALALNQLQRRPETIQAAPTVEQLAASDKAYAWLKSQMRYSGLVESFENAGTADNLAVVYDQAVAVSAFVVKGDLVNARKVLNALALLQQPDGSWYNIYHSDNPSQIIEWHRHVGPTVWVAMAVAKYELATGDTKTYHEMGLRAMTYGLGFQDVDGGINMGYEASPQTGLTHAWWASTEHNEDVYAAALYYGFPQHAARVRHFLENKVWAGDHWVGGRKAVSPAELDTRDPLDVNAWGVSALGASSGAFNYAATLDYNIAHHRTTINGITAFDFNSDANDIWFEGTGQMVVAFQEVGRTADANLYLNEMIEGQKANGGLPYSLLGTDNSYWVMTNANAVSSAGWLIFGVHGFNPFKLGTRVAAQAPAGFTPPTDTSASTKAYNWIKGQLRYSGLVESFENAGTADNLSVVYDDAVAAAAFVVKGDYVNARKVLNALRYLQQASGSWYNIYHSDNPSQVIEWHRHVGPTVWVAMAIAKYELATGDMTYHDVGLRAVRWALGFQDVDGGINMGYEASPQTGLTHAWWASTEHNEDVYAAALYYGFPQHAARVRHFLETKVWAGDHWVGGRKAVSPAELDLRDPLDVNAWGVSALGASYAATLDYNIAHHRTTINGITAFDFNSDANDIWFEGTGQMVVAFQEAGRSADATFYLNEMIEGQKANGGLPYSLLGTDNSYWVMTNANAVSSAGWLIFAAHGFNPFKLGTRVAAQAPAGFTPPTDTSASTKAYSWIKGQLRYSGLVESFENAGTADNLSVVYDDAVAAAAFVVKGDYVNARKVLNALRLLQQPNGSWYNIYHSDDPNRVIEWHRHVGPTVWVAMAVAKYELATGDTSTYRDMALQAMRFAAGFVDSDGGVNMGFEASPQTGLTHAWWASTEHNEDVYAAANYYGFTELAAQVKGFLDNRVWAGDHWVGGRKAVSPAELDLRDPLDVNAWGVSAFGPTGTRNYGATLDYNIAHHRTTINGITAFDFNSDANDIWFEGTGQMVVAFQEAGRSADATFYLNEMIEGQKANGGLPYSLLGTDNSYWVMTNANAVSSAGWLIFAAHGFNPFKLGTAPPPITPTPTRSPTRTSTPCGTCPTATNTSTATRTSTSTATRTSTSTPTATIPSPSSVLYVLDGAATGVAGQLSFGAGAAASTDSLLAANGNFDGTPSANTLVYTLSGLNGTYDATKATQFSLFLDSTTPGNTTQARISYDFTGDGTYDRVETYFYFATNDIAGWETYTQAQGQKSATGTFANLSNGQVRLELWNALGGGSSTVRTSASAANGSQSIVSIPFVMSPPVTSTATSTSTASTTATRTATATNTRTRTPTGPTATRTNTRTATPTGPTATRTRTRTPTGPTATRTNTRTATPTGPTATATRTRTTTATRTSQPGGNVAYVLDGAASGVTGALSFGPGAAASSDTIASAGGLNRDGTPTNALVYVVSGVNRTYDATKTTQFSLYLDSGASVGNGVQARVSYDFTGDGSYDRVETYNYFPTNDVVGWELYTQAWGQSSATGSFANLVNGRVRLEVWSAIGNGTSMLRTSATAADGSQSRLTIPFN